MAALPEINTSTSTYIVWGADETPYGPVDFPALVDWVKEERIVADSWIYARATAAWVRASLLPELKDHFTTLAAVDRPLTSGFRPGTLRRIKILAELSDAQLTQLATYLEIQEANERTLLFQQGDASDAMYLVMSGEVRAKLGSGASETILATLGPGEFFGDMALFDHGPRSADAICNVDSVLLKLTSVAFERMAREVPALATPFLQATARTLSARIRNDNKRLARVTQQYSASRSL